MVGEKYIDLGFKRSDFMEIKEVICRCVGNANNEASKALALSCGFTYQYAEKRTDLRNGKPYQLEVYNKGIEI